MRIDEKWSIESGGDCFVVVERCDGRNPKTGKPTQTEHRTYHPTLGQCAKKITRSQTLDFMQEQDIWQAVIEIESATNRLISALEQENTK